ncbi:MAG TPA: prepilin-type N-terminal cleavage/methylation domain-containing protein [Pyrinomonadaceae bacterium]|nr:prepilin-type N-terminal cleavage/methylation domain-containing protein [Pyrinomonadaceae bacterium]
MRNAPTINGFTLIELVITVAVLAILTLGVIPLVQVSVKRQKEEQLRAALREMREAIDQFHREALAGAQFQVNQGTAGGTGTGAVDPNSGTRAGTGGGGVNIFGDPRVRVFITDQTIFSADNPDRFPPDLQTLVEGVDVLPITAGSLGRRGNLTVNATDAATADAPLPKKKIYLRHIPDDPMTPEDESKGDAEWDFRSCYDAADANSWGGENIFDIHSKSKAKALDGTNYSDW